MKRAIILTKSLLKNIGFRVTERLQNSYYFSVLWIQDIIYNIIIFYEFEVNMHVLSVLTRLELGISAPLLKLGSPFVHYIGMMYPGCFLLCLKMVKCLMGCYTFRWLCSGCSRVECMFQLRLKEQLVVIRQLCKNYP